MWKQSEALNCHQKRFVGAKTCLNMLPWDTVNHLALESLTKQLDFKCYGRFWLLLVKLWFDASKMKGTVF